MSCVHTRVRIIMAADNWYSVSNGARRKPCKPCRRSMQLHTAARAYIKLMMEESPTGASAIDIDIRGNCIYLHKYTMNVCLMDAHHAARAGFVHSFIIMFKIRAHAPAQISLHRNLCEVLEHAHTCRLHCNGCRLSNVFAYLMCASLSFRVASYCRICTLVEWTLSFGDIIPNCRTRSPRCERIRNLRF